MPHAEAAAAASEIRIELVRLSGYRVARGGNGADGAQPAEPSARWPHRRRTQAERTAVLIASVALTNESWRPLAEGELVAVRAGELLATDSVAGSAGVV